MHACMHACMHAWTTYTHNYTHTQTHRHTDTHAHTHTNTYTHIHTCTDTYTQMHSQQFHYAALRYSAVQIYIHIICFTHSFGVSFKITVIYFMQECFTHMLCLVVSRKTRRDVHKTMPKNTRNDMNNDTERPSYECTSDKQF